jgi:hypothetical protein
VTVVAGEEPTVGAVVSKKLLPVLLLAKKRAKYGCGSKNGVKKPPTVGAVVGAVVSKNAAKLPPLVNELDELV